MNSNVLLLVLSSMTGEILLPLSNDNNRTTEIGAPFLPILFVITPIPPYFGGGRCHAAFTYYARPPTFLIGIYESLDWKLHREFHHSPHHPDHHPDT